MVLISHRLTRNINKRAILNSSIIFPGFGTNVLNRMQAKVQRSNIKGLKFNLGHLFVSWPSKRNKQTILELPKLLAACNAPSEPRISRHEPTRINTQTPRTTAQYRRRPPPPSSRRSADHRDRRRRAGIVRAAARVHAFCSPARSPADRPDINHNRCLVSIHRVVHSLSVSRFLSDGCITTCAPGAEPRLMPIPSRRRRSCCWTPCSRSPARTSSPCTSPRRWCAAAASRFWSEPRRQTTTIR